VFEMSIVGGYIAAYCVGRSGTRPRHDHKHSVKSERLRRRRRIVGGHLTNYEYDTNILVADSSYPEMLRSAEFCFVRECFLRNGLVLKTEITKTILFRTKQQKFDTPSSIKL
ncbi:hypothetical protein WA026_019784, partial [Henosepilachna vigintioctopunctata]